MKISISRFNSVMSSLREVGYAGLDKEEQAICDAADRGRLILSESRSSDVVFGEPSGEEFVPLDFNDADDVQTMADFA
jgi:hypothetical protein